MKTLITYFAKRHLLTNVLFFGLLLISLFVWKEIGKEEMPEFASNWVRVNTVYPGAPAEDVELFVTKPIEDELKGVVGIEEVVSTSASGVSSFRIVIDDNYPDKDEVVQDIKDAVLRTQLPTEVRDLPRIRQFKSSEKAILDIGIYHKGFKELTPEGRKELQKYVLSFENQLVALNEISSVEIDHYLKPELQILIDPRKKERVELSLTEILNQVRANNIRVPIGSMQDKGESKVTALNEYEDVASLNSLILRGTYEGASIRLGEIATIQDGFEKTTSIFKVNGHEGVFLNVRKSVSTDILTAQAALKKFLTRFKKANTDSPIEFVLMDDESYAVTNRLSIITSNGAIGFILIMLVLLVFLNFKSGYWVAMGIPFSMAFTLLMALIIGYTVNNMTLAGIIIVLGIVVDDAIIVAENIARKRQEGLSAEEASIEGSYEVFRPILASIITTCLAFLPLLFFEGFFGKLVAYIPLIVIFMLLASLGESLLILPAHLSSTHGLLDRFAPKITTEGWFDRYEKAYQKFLETLFKYHYLVLAFFLLILAGAGVLYSKKMKYVMFPREESQEVVIKVKAPRGTLRQDTAKLIDPIEMMAVADKENVVGVRSSVALSRRGGAVKENEASILVEIKPRDERTVPLRKLLAEWEAKSKTFPGLDEVKFLKGRWGHDSGSAIELQIQENNDQYRFNMAASLKEKLSQLPYLKEVEIEDPLIKKEYIFKIKQDMLIRLNVDPRVLTTALRTFVEGSIAYSINKGNEEVDVRVSVPDEVKVDIKEMLKLSIENRQGQLITLGRMVELTEVERPVNIQRTDYKRSTMIYADLADGTKITPLEVAEKLEEDIFPELQNKFPTTILKFRGEIEDTRESQGEFRNSILITVILIYLVLVLMFNSLFKPLLIIFIIPFGLAGLVYVLVAHGMSVYGFFAAVGALGMIGVVVNDAIVMIDKIENTLKDDPSSPMEKIAAVASTRLRPIIVTTLTTVVGVLPTAYGLAGYDSMLAEMMLVMGWGLLLGTFVTLILLPCLYVFKKRVIA